MIYYAFLWKPPTAHCTITVTARFCISFFFILLTYSLNMNSAVSFLSLLQSAMMTALKNQKTLNEEQTKPKTSAATLTFYASLTWLSGCEALEHVCGDGTQRWHLYLAQRRSLAYPWVETHQQLKHLEEKRKVFQDSEASNHHLHILVQDHHVWISLISCTFIHCRSLSFDRNS